jgi:hypothetical protein
MKAKQFIFTFPLGFIADNEKEAIKLLQEELNSWEESVLDADNWEVEEKEVDISG